MPKSVPAGVYAACLDEMWLVNMPFDQFLEETTRGAFAQRSEVGPDLLKPALDPGTPNPKKWSP
jgi:hypothetical protein